MRITAIGVCPRLTCHRRVLHFEDSTLIGKMEGLCHHCQQRWALGAEPLPSPLLILVDDEAEYRVYRNQAVQREIDERAERKRRRA